MGLVRRVGPDRPPHLTYSVLVGSNDKHGLEQDTFSTMSERLYPRKIENVISDLDVG